MNEAEGRAMLSDSDLPPLFHAADKSSSEGQTRYLVASRVRLTSLVVAALFGLFTWKLAPSPVDWAGVLATFCFLIALVVEAYLYQIKPDRTWYEGRAAAESVKTLSWRYAVGGDPLTLGARSEQEADELFLSQLRSLFDVIKDLDLTPPASSGQQITQAMRKVRALPLADRKKIYEYCRVEDQQRWYRDKAIWNKKRANQWMTAILIVEIAGALCGILKAVGVIEGDLLGFAGAMVAGMMAWLQTKQHRALATAFTVTALELASVRSKIAHQNIESDWAKFVSDAEEAFSREHTLWKASRSARSL